MYIPWRMKTSPFFCKIFVKLSANSFSPLFEIQKKMLSTKIYGKFLALSTIFHLLSLYCLQENKETKTARNCRKILERNVKV